jgi:diaminohydroxyphosphoribosylaminopyrimidine deaminase/5-amino-6-(5-phosphoribosylamino)uracil reductase
VKSLKVTESGSSEPEVTERRAMRRALELAVQGWGRVSTNPLVGAVLLRDGRVVGEGWHAEWGGPHAEAVALAACDDPAGTTCVVTLEPCAHEGKTPACSTALIDAAVARVVYAVGDPNPEAGGGAARLREAGVEVERGPLGAEAAALNAAFICAHRHPKRPYVALKLATSMDGFLADREGRSQWISGPEAREWVHWLRAGFDAIGVGRRTALADDPLLTVRGSVTPLRPPTRIVFGRSAELPENLKLMQTLDEVPVVLVAAEPGAEPTPSFRDEPLPPFSMTAPDRLTAPDLPAAFRLLRERAVTSLLVEGGGTLAGLLLDAGLVDRLYWIQAPVRLGGGVPAFGDTAPQPLGGAERWTVTERRSLGPDTLLVMDREPCSPES